MIINEYNEVIHNNSLVDNFYSLRKTSLNWNCLKDNGTLEFRTYNGTINQKLIQTYLIYSINLIKLAINLDSEEYYKGKIMELKKDIYYLDKYYVRCMLNKLLNHDLDKKRVYYYLLKNKFSIPNYVIKSIDGDGECKCSELYM